jgi:hypothetical protein
MKPTKEQVLALLNEAYSQQQHDLSQSVELAAKALSRSKQLKDKALIAQSLNQLSMFYLISGDFEQATAHAQEAAIYCQELEEEKKWPKPSVMPISKAPGFESTFRKESIARRRQPAQRRHDH